MLEAENWGPVWLSDLKALKCSNIFLDLKDRKKDQQSIHAQVFFFHNVMLKRCHALALTACDVFPVCHYATWSIVNLLNIWVTGFLLQLPIYKTEQTCSFKQSHYFNGNSYFLFFLSLFHVFLFFFCIYKGYV